MTTSEKKRVAIYARVSTRDKDQNPETQLRVLRRYVRDRGWKITETYIDQLSGRAGKRGKESQFHQLLADAHKRKFDVVLVWRYSRFARSTKQLIDALEDFGELGIDFVSYHENIDTTTSQAKLFFTIMAALAQFESDVISENIKDGMDRARDEGRHVGRPALPAKMTSTIIDSWLETKSMRRTSIGLNQPYATVHKVVTAFKRENTAPFEESKKGAGALISSS